MVIFIVVLVLLVLLMALGFVLAKYALSIRRQTLEEARKWQSEHYDISFFDKLKKEDYTVESYDGYLLLVHVLTDPASSQRYVLLSHGYTDNHLGSLKYTQMYLDLGFNVILYDLRGHGENEPTFCSYSIREGHDLACLIEDCRRRYGDNVFFGIHGESLGSASSIACLKYHPHIDFVVADCGFSEITSVMKAGLKGMHLPQCLIHVASLCAKIRYGYFFHEMRPIDSLKDNEIPICFIHGEKDDFILPMHSERMQKATKGYSEIHMIPEATHAASVLYAPELYRQYVSAFLARIEK